VSRTGPVAPESLRWGVVVACAAVILVASVVDTGGGPPRTLFGVGLAGYLHLAGYAGLAGAVGFALRRADHRGLLLAVGAAVCYGLAVEVVQAPLPYRTASILDALVNAAGAVVGASLWRAVAPGSALDRTPT